MAKQAAKFDREVKRLKEKAANAIRHMKSAQRSKQRIQKKMEQRYANKKSKHATTPVNHPTLPKTTPRSSARSLFQKAVSSPKCSHRSLARCLTYLNSLEQSVQKAAAVSTKTKETDKSALFWHAKKPAGGALQHVHTRRIWQCTSPSMQLPKKQREPARHLVALRDIVIQYLCEQSRQNPGKKDFVLVKDEKVQSLTCTDYI